MFRKGNTGSIWEYRIEQWRCRVGWLRRWRRGQTKYHIIVVFSRYHRFRNNRKEKEVTVIYIQRARDGHAQCMGETRINKSRKSNPIIFTISKIRFLVSCVRSNNEKIALSVVCIVFSRPIDWSFVRQTVERMWNLILRRVGAKVRNVVSGVFGIRLKRIRLTLTYRLSMKIGKERRWWNTTRDTNKQRLFCWPKQMGFQHDKCNLFTCEILWRNF